MGFAYSLPWQSNGITTTSCKAIVNDWQVNGAVRGVQRHAVHGDGERHGAEHAEQHADGGPRRHVQRARQHRRRRQVVRHDARSRSRPACVSATRAATSSTAPAATTSTSRCSVRSRSADAKRLEVRMEAGNIFNHGGLQQPAGQHHVGHVRPDHRRRGRHRADQRPYPERQIRLGCGSVLRPGCVTDCVFGGDSDSTAIGDDRRRARSRLLRARATIR